tara:strand:- start:6640 stop:7041 length:402 start_codon:yes stop_codon:yes gene_type:complete
MAVDLDNMDKVLANMAKLEKAVDLEVIREVRKKFKAIVRKYMPRFKKATPKQTGAMIKSIKIKSRSSRGVTRIKMTYFAPYAGIINQTNKNKKSRQFANEEYKQDKKAIEAQGKKAMKDSFREVFERHGVKVK